MRSFVPSPDSTRLFGLESKHDPNGSRYPCVTKHARPAAVSLAQAVFAASRVANGPIWSLITAPSVAKIGFADPAVVLTSAQAVSASLRDENAPSWTRHPVALVAPGSATTVSNGRSTGCGFAGSLAASLFVDVAVVPGPSRRATPAPASFGLAACGLGPNAFVAAISAGVSSVVAGFTASAVAAGLAGGTVAAGLPVGAVTTGLAVVAGPGDTGRTAGLDAGIAMVATGEGGVAADAIEPGTGPAGGAVVKPEPVALAALVSGATLGAAAPDRADPECAGSMPPGLAPPSP